jgi:hypothetical protein
MPRVLLPGNKKVARINMVANFSMKLKNLGDFIGYSLLSASIGSRFDALHAG